MDYSVRIKVKVKINGTVVDTHKTISKLKYELFNNKGKQVGKGKFDKHGCSKVYPAEHSFELFSFKLFHDDTFIRTAYIYSLEKSVKDKYNKSTFHFKYSAARLNPDKNYVKEVKIRLCPHKINGAIAVANFMAQEIKKNTRSDKADRMRQFNRQAPLNPSLYLAAHIEWGYTVFAGNKWDHKTIIHRTPKLQAVAVHRKLDPLHVVREKRQRREKLIAQLKALKNSPSDNKEWIGKQEEIIRMKLRQRENTPLDSKSYWHKYKHHDYFYDVWSNIHYGYVGLSCGFLEKVLLKGAAWAQKIDNVGSQSGDDPDDITAINIGFELFKEHGYYADKLTAYDILDKLEAANFKNSRELHLCRHPNKLELENDGTVT